MLALDPDIIVFACLSNGYLTVLEGVTIVWDFLESICKVISDYVGKPYNYNVFLVLVYNLVRYFVSWDFLAGSGKF